MKRYETSVVVSRPIDEVWAFLLDPFSQPRVSSSWLAVRQTSPGPPGLGSTFRGRVAILGVEKPISGAVTEWDPPRRVALSFTGMGMRSGRLQATLEATDSGTKVVRRADLEPGPMLRSLWWIIGPWWRGRMIAADREFKRLLETGRG